MTYVISFLNFEVGDLLKDYEIGQRFSLHYVTREIGCGHQLPASPEYHFYDLTKFKKTEEEIDNAEDYWLYLLTQSKGLERIPRWVEGRNDYEAYFEASRRAKFTQDEIIRYTTDMVNEIDRIGAMNYARDEGFAQGQKVGMQQGMQQGHIDVARAMKANGIDIDTIVKCTGLTEEQVATL